MIIWIASYPKSGNTWVRSLINSYYFSKENFEFSDLNNIPNFSVGSFVDDKSLLKNNLDVTKQWLNAQKLINKDNKKTFFFKTHNACVALNKNLFTDKINTAGCIYIVRDPRNIITSYKNFEKKSYETILNHMTNRNAFLFANTDFERKFNFKGFEFIGSWMDHYRSWAHNKLGIPICIIKYEDLMNNTHVELEKIIDFIVSVQNIKNYSFNLKRASKAINASSFKTLSKVESEKGFSEARKGQKFFNLGKKNMWQDLLPVDIKNEIEKNFYSEMKELKYLD